MNAHPSAPARRRNTTLSLLAVLLLLASSSAAEPPAGTFSQVQPEPARQLVLRAGHHHAGTRVLPDADVAHKLLPKTATFDVTYNGFTPAAEAAFQHAIDIWEQLITSSVPIRVEANWTPLGPGILGSAGANLYWSDTVYVYPDALADALNGADLGGGGFDILANFSSDFTWYLGTDGNPSAGQYDLVTVVLHEIAHGLGFAGLMNVSEIGIGHWLLSVPAIYASLAEDLAGTRIIDPVAYPSPSMALGAVLQNGDIYFAGPLAVEANGDVRPELYAPSPWQSGSSFSHLDEIAFPPGHPDSLMTPFLDFAEAIHSPGDVGLCIFQDIGWTTLCVEPPPATSLSADLIVPGFEVDALDPQGLNTFFAVRNTSDGSVDVEVDYHGEAVTDTPLRTDVFNLGPQQTVTVKVGSDLTDLNVNGGRATGLILISEAGASTGSLEGDYFRLDPPNAFATGDRLVRTAEFCQTQEVRFVDFGSGAKLRFLIQDPQADTQASVTYTAYDEAGVMLGAGEFFTSDHLSVLDVADLALGESFGTLVLDFSSSGGGWVGAEYSAFGIFSVELNGACRD